MSTVPEADVNPILEARIGLRDLLDGDGVQAFTTEPDKATPPLVFVSPGYPYVSHEGAFAIGTRRANLIATVVASAGVNDVQADELDDLVLRVLDLVDRSRTHYITLVDRPGRITLNGQSYLACNVEVARDLPRRR